MSTTPRQVLALLVAVASLLALRAGPARGADAPRATATFLPGSVPVEPGSTAEVRWVLANPTSEPVRLGDPSVTTNEVELAFGRVPATIDAGGQASVPVVVSAGSRLAVATTAIVELPVSVGGVAGPPLLSTLEVTPSAPLAPATPIEASIDAGGGDLNQLQSTDARLVVENKTRQPLVVVCIATLTPRGISVSGLSEASVADPADCHADGRPVTPKVDDDGTVHGPVVAPGSTRLFPFTISVHGRVRPATDKLTVVVDTARVHGGGTVTRTATSVDITPSVFGSSVLLVALGIPSLLFAPGFLFLFGLRWSRRAFGFTDARWPWSDVKSAEFVLLAVFLSIVATGLYAGAMALAGRTANVTAFSIGYLLWWWGISLVLGGAIGGVWGYIAQKAIDEATPEAWDDWHDLLAYLDRNALGPKLESGAPAEGTGRLLKIKEVPDGVWVTPEVLVETDDEATRRAIWDATTTSALRSAINEAKATITQSRYSTTGTIKKPKLVKANEVTWSGQRHSVVSVEEPG